MIYSELLTDHNSRRITSYEGLARTGLVNIGTHIAVLLLLSSTILASPIFLRYQDVLAQSQTIQVTIFDCSGSNCNPGGGGYGFKPAVLNITTGTTVTWVNTGFTTHTTTDTESSPYWDSGSIAPGGSYSKFFGSAGVYHYECTIHPFMKGIINATGPTVQPPPANSSLPLLYVVPAVVVVAAFAGIAFYILRGRKNKKQLLQPK